MRSEPTNEANNRDNFTTRDQKPRATIRLGNAGVVGVDRGGRYAEAGEYRLSRSGRSGRPAVVRPGWSRKAAIRRMPSSTLKESSGGRWRIMVRPSERLGRGPGGAVRCRRWKSGGGLTGRNLRPRRLPLQASRAAACHSTKRAI